MSDLMENPIQGVGNVVISDVDFFQQVKAEKKAEEEKKASQRKKSYVEYNVNNYINIKLSDGQKEKDVIVRPLPFDPENGINTCFKRIHSHMVRSVENGKQQFRYFICNKHTEGIEHLGYGKRCPFCECLENSLKELSKEKDETKRKMFKDMIKACNLYNQWLMRLIDRSDENYGPKIFRFNDVNNKEGTYDKLEDLFHRCAREAKKYKNIEDYSIFDKNIGRDIIFKVERKLKQDGTSTSGITKVIDSDEETPISINEELMTKWINDEKKWYHLFPPKPFGYLLVKMVGGNPFLVPNTTDVWSDKNEYDEIERKKGTPIFNFEKSCWEDGSNGVVEDSKTEEAFMELQNESTSNNPKENNPFEDDEIPF